ncbi:MAG: hypothetical protein ACSHX0_04685 [Akkermansiaceae bacterium]
MPPLIKSTQVVLTLLALSITAFASDLTTNDIALSYLNRIAQKSAQLFEETALSEQCSAQRRKELEQKVLNFSAQHLRENDIYSVIEENNQKAFSAVLISVRNQGSPLDTRVHGIALVNKNDTWLPAPLPGSFTNSGYGYDSQVEKTVRALEEWMIKASIKHEEEINEFEFQKLTDQLSKIKKDRGATLLTNKETLLNFIEHCREKDLEKALVSMGFGNDSSSESLKSALQHLNTGFAQNDINKLWTLMTSEDVIVQVLNGKNDASSTTVGFFNPLGENNIHFIDFQLTQTEEEIIVKLPEDLTSSNLPENQRLSTKKKIHINKEKSEEFLTSIITEHSKKTFLTAQQAHQHLLAAFGNRNFSQCVELLPRIGDFYSDEANQHKALTNLSLLWKELRSFKESALKENTILEDGNLAYAPINLSLAANPGEYKNISIWYVKDLNGWHILDDLTLAEYKEPSILTSANTLKEKFQLIQAEQNKKHLEKTLNQITVLTPSLLNKNTKEAITEDAAIDIVKKFRETLRDRDTELALAMGATIIEQPSINTLKNMQYSIKGAASDTEQDQVLGTFASGSWRGVSVQTKSKTGEIHDYPLYLIVDSNQGAKIILDIDLRHEINKGRELLNSKTWLRINASLTAIDSQHIQSIYTEHTKLAEIEIKKEIQVLE